MDPNGQTSIKITALDYSPTLLGLLFGGTMDDTTPFVGLYNDLGSYNRLGWINGLQL